MVLTAPVAFTAPFHPVTLEYERTSSQIAALLGAIEDSGLPTVFTLPNADTCGGGITRAVRRFVKAQPMRAGYAASDLGDWGRWDFVPAFEQALDTDRPQVFASRYAAVLYLLRNPTPEAKAALERLRAKGRL